MVNAIAVVQNDDDGCGTTGGFLDSGCGNPQAQYATCLLEKGHQTVDATGSYIQPNSGGQRWGVGDRNGPTGQPGDERRLCERPEARRLGPGLERELL